MQLPGASHWALHAAWGEQASTGAQEPGLPMHSWVESSPEAALLCLHFEVWILPWGHLRAPGGTEGSIESVYVCAICSIWNSEREK